MGGNRCCRYSRLGRLSFLCAGSADLGQVVCFGGSLADRHYRDNGQFFQICSQLSGSVIAVCLVKSAGLEHNVRQCLAAVGRRG